MMLRATVLGVVGAFVIAGVGCGPAPSAPTKAAAPAMGRGFRYDAAAGEPRVTTIRLGDQVRIFAVVPEWMPATVSLIDEQGATVRVFRMDLPPSGVIDADIPELAASEKIRVYFAPVAAPFERRIGVDEPVLTTERVKEIAPGLGGAESGTKKWEIDVKGLETSVKPGTRRACVVGLTHTFFESTSGVDAVRTLSDEEWLTPAVREAIAKARSTEPE